MAEFELSRDQGLTLLAQLARRHRDSQLLTHLPNPTRLPCQDLVARQAAPVDLGRDGQLDAHLAAQPSEPVRRPPDNLPGVAEQRAQRQERPEELGPLPGGHHGLSRQQIHDSQRERLLAAMAGEVAARGYRATTITEVVKLASVSTRDFYGHFEGKEECFLAAFEAIRDHLEGVIAAAAAAEDDWPHQVIAALRAALEFFAAEPDLGRLCLVEPVSATPTIAIRFREAVLACVPPLARGRNEQGNGASLPESTEDSLIGGVVSLATRSILAGESEKLPALLPDLVDFALSPYLGAERAAELAAEARAD